jgi:hypothetical protein
MPRTLAMCAAVIAPQLEPFELILLAPALQSHP